MAIKDIPDLPEAGPLGDGDLFPLTQGTVIAKKGTLGDVKDLFGIPGIQSSLAGKEDAANKGSANGYASLDADGKVPEAELPPLYVSPTLYKGSWNADTNTPTLTSGEGETGWLYVVSDAGSTELDGISSWAVGDQVIFDGTAWTKVPNDIVTSRIADTPTSIAGVSTDTVLSPSGGKESVVANAWGANYHRLDDDEVSLFNIQRKLSNLSIGVTEFASPSEAALVTAIENRTITDSEDEDCTALVSKAVDAIADHGKGELFVPPGLYRHRQLMLPTNFTWRGVPGLSEFRVSQNIVDGTVPIVMDAQTGETGAWSNQNVYIEGIIFDGGSRTMTSHTAIMRAWSIDRFSMEHCWLRNNYYQLLSCSGNREVRLKNNRWTNWGRQTDPWGGTYDPDGGGSTVWSEGGAAAHISFNTLADPDSMTETAWLCDNYFEGGEWSCFYVFGRRHIIRGNIMRNFKEGNYATNRSSDGTDFGTSLVVGNIIDGCARKYIQAAGMELGSKNVLVAHNIISNCDGAGIDLNRESEDVDCVFNKITDCAANVDNEMTYRNYGQINVRNGNLVSEAPKNTRIMFNTIRDTRSPKLAPYAISARNMGSNAKASGLIITDNDVRGGYLTSPFNIESGLISGSDYIVQNNLGAETVLSPSPEWTPTVYATSGSGTFTVGAHRLRRVAGVVFVELGITITDIGTAANILRATMPSASPYSVTFNGINATTGVALVGTMGATSDTLSIRDRDGNFPGTTGDVLRITGFYFEA